jgi:signal peptidase I
MKRAPAWVRARRRRTWLDIVAWGVTALFIVAIAAISWPAALGGSTTWVTVSGTSMEPNYATGDLVLARNDGQWQIGDVVVYRVQGESQGLIVHRLVSGNATEGWYAQGDNKPRIDPWLIPDSSVLGREVLHIPYAGGAISWIRSPQVLAVLCGILVFWAVLTGPRVIKRRFVRVPVDEPAVVDGHAAHVVDIHQEGARFSVGPGEYTGDVTVEVWLPDEFDVTRVVTGTLTVRHDMIDDAGRRLIGGPVDWGGQSSIALINQHCTLTRS